MVLKIVFAAVTVYGALLLFVALFSELFIFYPPAAKDTPDGTFFVQTSDGTDIAALLIPGDGRRQVVLFSLGNAENMASAHAELKRLSSRLGVDVALYDYPGYGASGGKASENGAYRAIEAVYGHLTGGLGYGPEQIVLYGRSVGSGPTCHLAATRPVSAVILESPFVSAFRVVTQVPVFPFDRFSNLRHVKTINLPILFWIGTRDFVVPNWHGRKLFAQSPSQNKRLEVVKGAGHNNLVSFAGDHYYRVLESFLQSSGSRQTFFPNNKN